MLIEKCKLSVIMTVYNAERFVYDAIQSVLNQSYKDFKFIIVNDGSTDKSLEVIESIEDPRVSLYNFAENKGVGYASHFALSKANGEYITNVDADDILRENRFEVQINYLDEHKEVSVVDSYVNYFADSKEVEKSSRFRYYKTTKEKHINKNLSVSEMSKEIYMHSIVINGAMMARNEILTEYGINQELKIAEDYDLFYRINIDKHFFYKIPQVLTDVRITSTSTTAKYYDKNFETIFIIKQNEINKLLDTEKKIAIWGASKLGITLNKLLQDKCKRNADIFIDSFSKEKETQNGTKILRPKEVDFGNYVVLVASSPGKFEIYEYLKNFGMVYLRDFLVFI